MLYLFRIIEICILYFEIIFFIFHFKIIKKEDDKTIFEGFYILIYFSMIINIKYKNKK